MKKQVKSVPNPRIAELVKKFAHAVNVTWQTIGYDVCEGGEPSSNIEVIEICCDADNVQAYGGVTQAEADEFRELVPKPMDRYKLIDKAMTMKMV